ncbi:hypothetical protein [Leifsonia sp. RAF41]|uniref:hypothetical protein n=1 Tax=Leifsonia sp. RAF41 TaxID=3233056 RepID=UPI003F9CB80C
MSISIRRPSDPPETPDAKPSKKKKAPVAPPPHDVGDLRIGGDPRVDLLPPEVRSSRRNARTRRGFTWGVLAVFLFVIVASGAAFGYDVVAQTQLLTAQAKANELLAEQQKYLEVRNVQNQVDIAVAAQQVGASTEVDWQKFLTEVGKAEPKTMLFKKMTIDSATPIANYQQSTDPLQGPRIATVTFQAVSATFPDVPTWVRGLLKVDGVVDAVPGTVNLDATGVYTSTVTIHLSESLYTKRFQTKGQ